MKFNHINDVIEYLAQFKTLDELEEAFGEIPTKFGNFAIENKDTYESDGYFEVCNSYYDDIFGMQCDYFTIDI